MFCFCCNSATPLAASRFFAEGLTTESSDVTSALQRRAAYERRKAYSRAPVSHPGKIDMVIRGVRALTMDPSVGDVVVMDIHVRDGEIVDIGCALPATAMLDIDGRGLVALPGLIADHSHPAMAIASAPGEVDNEAVYRTVRLALLDLMSSGVTFVHQCARPVPQRQAEAALLAHIDSGLRGCFSYPSSDPDEDHDVMTELAERWPLDASDDRVDVRAPRPQDFSCVTDSATHLAGRTIEAAERLGLDPWTGSIAPGKRADLILVDPERSHGTLDPDPRAWSASDIHAGNVVLVCADGRLRKRNGVIVEPNEGLIRQEGQEALHDRNPQHQAVRS
jgi:cytosine/adenosine deaminase-related metal-dependent hydrolase